MKSFNTQDKNEYIKSTKFVFTTCQLLIHNGKYSCRDKQIGHRVNSEKQAFIDTSHRHNQVFGPLFS